MEDLVMPTVRLSFACTDHRLVIERLGLRM